MAGENLLSCYEFTDWCCDFVLKQIYLMENESESELPEECPPVWRESIGSLMIAAARFPDMPELAKLRNRFEGKYGSGLENFGNQDFAKKIATTTFTTVEKLKCLQDIASKYSINWDSKIESSLTAWGQHKRSNDQDSDESNSHDARVSEVIDVQDEKAKESKRDRELSHEPEKLISHLHPSPKPRSVWKKYYNQNYEEDGYYGVRSISSFNKGRNERRNDNDWRREMEILSEEEEEEQMIDILLQHYSTKPSSYSDPQKFMITPQSTAAAAPVTTRSISLPSNRTGGTEPVEVYTCAHYNQPLKYIRPELPDDEDSLPNEELIARFNALKHRLGIFLDRWPLFLTSKDVILCVFIRKTT